MRALQILLLAATLVLLTTPITATAQAPPDSVVTVPAEGSGLVGDLVEFFTNEALAVMFAMLVGLGYKFLPAARNFANAWIPVVTAFAGWLVHVFMPTPALASPLGDIARGAGGVMFPVVMGLFDSWASRKIFEGWLRQPTDAWRKPLPDLAAPAPAPARVARK